ncbi:MAG: hypothetical protein KAR54_02625 [Candidatus Pacebacteria bacterium]|nr:hypothetical protein [Candidatus Paceibacterota bacterium]
MPIKDFKSIFKSLTSAWFLNFEVLIAVRKGVKEEESEPDSTTSLRIYKQFYR